MVLSNHHFTSSIYLLSLVSLLRVNVEAYNFPEMSSAYLEQMYFGAVASVSSQRAPQHDVGYLCWGALGFKKVLVLSGCGNGLEICGRYGWRAVVWGFGGFKGIQLIRVWVKVFSGSFLCWDWCRQTNIMKVSSYEDACGKLQVLAGR